MMVEFIYTTALRFRQSKRTKEDTTEPTRMKEEDVKRKRVFAGTKQGKENSQVCHDQSAIIYTKMNLFSNILFKINTALLPLCVRRLK